MSEKIYINGIIVKERQTNFGPVIGVNIKVSEFIAEIAKHGENDWVRLEISPRKTPTDKQTHSVSLDTWKPTPKVESDLPF